MLKKYVAGDLRNERKCLIAFYYANMKLNHP